MELSDLPALSGAKFLGHIREFREDRLRLLVRMAHECRDAGTLRMFQRTALFVNAPRMAHEVLVEKAKSFEKATGVRMALHPLAGEGLFTSEGALWRRQRRLMAPIFQHSQVAEFARCMTECAHRGADTWADGESMDLARETTRITMSVVGRALFDAETFEEADQIGEALTTSLRWADDWAGSGAMVAHIMAIEALKSAHPRVRDGYFKMFHAAAIERLRAPVLPPTAATRRMRAAIATLDARVARMIAERRAAGLHRDDLLTSLLRARDEDGTRMDDRQVRDEALTLFVAGHETTASALAWAFYLLARHPAAYARVRAEGDALAGRAPSMEDLSKLSYSLMVFKEAMRLYPPVYLYARQAVAEVSIGGCRVPKGTIVFLSPYTMHRREELYPDPERFDPERFAPGAEESRPKSSYLPFSGGPRVCIGNHFALMEGQILLATLAHRATFELASERAIVPEPRSTLRPSGGIPMTVRLREPQRARADSRTSRP